MKSEDFSTLCQLTDQELFAFFDTSCKGLSSFQAKKRKELTTPARTQKKISSTFFLLLSQFKSPLILLLLICSIGAFFLSDKVDASLIIAIVLISALLGFYQEFRAGRALERLSKLVKVNSCVIRNSQELFVPTHELVYGDIIVLKAGDIVPADCILFQSNHLFINEATLTGESEPKEKFSIPSSQELRTLYMGTAVISGYGMAIVALTLEKTIFGKIAESIKAPQMPTAFEKGVNKLGFLLVQVTFVLVLIIFAINMVYKRPFLEAFLFALALGIGLTPQLLPMIITVNLSSGARFLAKKRVIVKKLSAIENFGSMTVLCSDKTGTLTEGVMSVEGAFDAKNTPSERALLYACVNAKLQSGFKNPIDDALLRKKNPLESEFEKLDEIPFDFESKRVSILALHQNEKILIVKGALTKILPLCSKTLLADGKIELMEDLRMGFDKILNDSAKNIYKLLGVAYKLLEHDHSFSKEDENELIFAGYIQILDPLKKHAFEELSELKRLGISVKIISGDHFCIVNEIGKRLGIVDKTVKGAFLKDLSSQELIEAASKYSLFAEVDPIDKDKIVDALQKSGHIVGFLGDGINDCAAMKRSDVAISVDTGANIAKESADLILLSHSLKVLKEGVIAGRKTFANTLKYIFMATSANFGNMFSMAFSSLILPFIPFLPKQILLINFLTDIPEFTISTDQVDENWLISPQHWDFNFIKKFMIVFGLISSIFDFITFFLFKHLSHTQAEFRTAWFLESVISAAMVLLVIRSKHSILVSKPSLALSSSVFAILFITTLIPYTSIGPIFNFTTLPLVYIGIIYLIVFTYMLVCEIAKSYFYRKQ